jgi:proteasome lid subunit RPN8/RPN11
MVRTNHDYRLVIFTLEGSMAGVFSVPHPDWETAFEAAWLHALRKGTLRGTEPYFDVRLEPAWHETLGVPWVGGFRVAPELNGRAATHELALPFTLFKSYAAQSASALVEHKALAANSVYHYLVQATPQESVTAASDPSVGSSTLRLAPLTLQAHSLDRFATRSLPLGEIDTGDIRVFIPERVLDEVSEQTSRAGESETGSILLGHLHRDTATEDVFLEITAQVPAPHTSATQTKLTFTAATWAAVRAAVAQRQRGELMVGWFHSHPQKHWKWKCSESCPPEKRAVCPFAGAAFFSEDDVALHRAIFPRAFCVALLVTVTDGGLGYAMFGWRQGAIQQRSFELIVERDPARYLPRAGDRVIVGETCHEHS